MKWCPTLLRDCFQHVCGMKISERALQVKGRDKVSIYKEINRNQNIALEDVNIEAKLFLELQNPSPSAPPL